MFKNKTILITGGTGSFGGAVLERLLKEDVKEIRVFSRDEKKQDDLRNTLRNTLINNKVKFYLGDVRDYNSINSAMKNVDYVFHAAALKQVPSCEFFPMEAVKTNIIGVENSINAAINNNVKRIVILSTDKAVYPINAMGISKAMAEKIAISKANEQIDGGTVICCTRYGNVMASRGSVIPLFVSQLKNGKDITVTDSEMTRFLMSLEDSIDLVLYALLNGRQGDIFIQKSPAATVGNLAQALKELFNNHNKIKTIGTRHGEKQHESLISKEESVRTIDCGDYFCIKSDNRDLNYNKYFIEGSTKEPKEYTSFNTRQLDVEETKRLLLSLNYIKEELDA